MPQSAHLDLGNVEAEGPRPFSNEIEPNMRELSCRAQELARNLAWLPGQHTSRPLWNRYRKLARVLEPLLRKLEAPAPKTVSEDFRWLYDNLRLIETELEDAREAFKRPKKLPHVRTQNDTVIPRVAAIADDLLAAAEYRFEQPGFTAYVQAFQEATALKMVELWTLVSMLKLCLLEQIAARGRRQLQDPAGSCGLEVLIRSL